MSPLGAGVVHLGVFGLLAAHASAHVTRGRDGIGLIGYGIKMYDPPCAYGCKDTVTAWMLDCGDDAMSGDDMAGMHMSSTTPECYATNDPFLQTMAWCISTHCQGVSMAKLEHFWETDLVAHLEVQPTPKISYQQALANVTTPPTTILDADAVLNTTSLVDEETYLGNYNGDRGFESMEGVSNRYGIVLIVTCTMIPMFLSFLRFLPLPQPMVSKFYAWFIDPPLFGQYHSVPVLGLGFVPTRGQALFIAYIWAINIILCSVGYVLTNPMSWYDTTEAQLMAFIANRTGVLSWVNLALTILYSSRNNVLLYLTNWSHSTYLLIHRWIAVICMLQACLHSAIYLQSYVAMGGDSYAEESKLSYWVWGIVATLCLSILMPASILPIRQKAYEVFLASHILLSVLAMIGSILHIWYRFQWQWGYQNWIWVSFGIWLFDRFVARPLRLARNGIKKAIVTIIDDDYLKIEIAGVEAEGQVYLYFPTLTWRVWENHPFSVAAVSGPRTSVVTQVESQSKRGSEDMESDKDKVKSPPVPPVQFSNGRAPGLTFYVRRMGGLTAQFAKHANSTQGITVLVESSYGSEQMSLVVSPTTRPSMDYPNLICIAGGVGITAVLPLLDRAGSLFSPLGTVKLFWSTRTEALVRSVEELVGQQGIAQGGTARWASADVSVSIGERFNLRQVLEGELNEAAGGTTVVVCGPPGMADEVRSIVTALGRNGAVVRLSEESFSW